MAVSAVWRLVYFLAPYPSEPKEQTAAHRRDALCPSNKIQKQAAFGISHPSFQLPQRGRQITACRDWRSKNETDASSLVEVCFLIATFVQRMRPRRILLILKILQIDSLRSPFGLP